MNERHQPYEPSWYQNRACKEAQLVARLGDEPLEDDPGEEGGHAAAQPPACPDEVDAVPGHPHNPSQVWLGGTQDTYCQALADMTWPGQEEIPG